MNDLNSNPALEKAEPISKQDDLNFNNEKDLALKEIDDDDSEFRLKLRNI